MLNPNILLAGYFASLCQTAMIYIRPGVISGRHSVTCKTRLDKEDFFRCIHSRVIVIK